MLKSTKNMIKRILLTIFLLLFIIGILFISNLIFYITFFPAACMYGKNINRDFAISSIDRGDFILPNGIDNVSFSISFRTSALASICFAGKVNYIDFNDWCERNEIKLVKKTNITLLPWIVNHLKLKNKIIRVGYVGENNYGYMYDEEEKTCYVYLSDGLGSPISLSELERMKILFFPYLTNYWRDVEVTQSVH